MHRHRHRRHPPRAASNERRGRAMHRGVLPIATIGGTPRRGTRTVRRSNSFRGTMVLPTRPPPPLAVEASRHRHRHRSVPSNRLPSPHPARTTPPQAPPPPPNEPRTTKTTTNPNASHPKLHSNLPSRPTRPNTVAHPTPRDPSRPSRPPANAAPTTAPPPPRLLLLEPTDERPPIRERSTSRTRRIPPSPSSDRRPTSTPTRRTRLRCRWNRPRGIRITLRGRGRSSPRRSRTRDLTPSGPGAGMGRRVPSALVAALAAERTAGIDRVRRSGTGFPLRDPRSTTTTAPLPAMPTTVRTMRRAPADDKNNNSDNNNNNGRRNERKRKSARCRRPARPSKKPWRTISKHHRRHCHRRHRSVPSNSLPSPYPALTNDNNNNGRINERNRKSARCRRPACPLTKPRQTISKHHCRLRDVVIAASLQTISLHHTWHSPMTTRAMTE
mmetsp:Transcript_33096/g.71530  ORF Transcript_33096/g.71530 Transcript_33096/m.71530 type:complete len:442 (-) Transcript_33096:1082-2407(-)